MYSVCRSSDINYIQKLHTKPPTFFVKPSSKTTSTKYSIATTFTESSTVSTLTELLTVAMSFLSKSVISTAETTTTDTD